MYFLLNSYCFAFVLAQATWSKAGACAWQQNFKYVSDNHCHKQLKKYLPQKKQQQQQQRLLMRQQQSSLGVVSCWNDLLDLEVDDRESSTTATTSSSIGSTRRSLFRRLMGSPVAALAFGTSAGVASVANAASASDSSSTSTSDFAEVTDRIFLEVKGLPSTSSSSSSTTQRIVIGLFGKEAPSSVAKLKQLVSSQGLPAPCKPRVERTLQKEQLEANKVYNNCIDNQEKGVNYDYSSIWRVIKNERIDVGAVAGKFLSRENPNWQEDKTSELKHDVPGIISVRRGDESGFGFMIYPGNGGAAVEKRLDTDQIIVGKVLEGVDIVQELNDIPVITSSKVNYMGLTGGPTTKVAPNRSCQYGGPMYCNENKPLIKLTIFQTGLL